MAPNLPARKAGGKRVAASVPSSKNLPILQAQEIELEDGTKIPIKIPPGMPPHQAQALIAYLKANPDAAKQVHAQAQQILKTPGMAHAFMNMQNSVNEPGAAEKYQALKDDPELKEVFDDVVANGPAAFQKYWDDAELMQKISAKLRGASLADGSAPAAPRPPAGPAANLHDAAKKGDVEAIDKFLAEEGASVDAVNERGITALGVAVGFNQTSAVTHLLSKGANLEAQDPAGNTVLHYAAGYGRKAIAQQLIDAGADVNAMNKAGLKPVDAAKMNKEKQLVELLQKSMGQNPEAEGKPEETST